MSEELVPAVVIDKITDPSYSLFLFVPFHKEQAHAYTQVKYTKLLTLPLYTTLDLILAFPSHFILSQLNDLAPNTLSWHNPSGSPIGHFFIAIILIPKPLAQEWHL